MADVSLVLEGVEGFGFEEVRIRRKLYRSGESEYSINGVKCRLKDITEMLLDTGMGARAYSIVEQGQIESFIISKPEEKRKFIEEVAGIEKYKLRRKETRSRIESTKENLTRVLDMKREVSDRIEEVPCRQSAQGSTRSLPGGPARLNSISSRPSSQTPRDEEKRFLRKSRAQSRRSSRLRPERMKNRNLFRTPGRGTPFRAGNLDPLRRKYMNFGRRERKTNTEGRQLNGRWPEFQAMWRT